MYSKISTIAKEIGCSFIQVIDVNKNKVNIILGHEEEVMIQEDDYYIVQVIKGDKYSQIELPKNIFTEIDIVKKILQFSIEYSNKKFPSRDINFETISGKIEGIYKENNYIYTKNEIKKIKEKIENELNCKVLNIVFEEKRNVYTLNNGNNCKINQVDNSSTILLLLSTSNNQIKNFVFNDISIKSLPQVLKDSLLDNKLINTVHEITPISNKLVKFSEECSKKLVFTLISLFNGSNVLRGNTAIQKDDITKELFDSKLTLSLNSNQLIDEQGFRCNGTLIEKGKIVGFINSIETKNHLEGPVGCYFNSLIEVREKYLKFILDKLPSNEYEIYITCIDSERIFFDPSTGKVEFVAYGRYRDQGGIVKFLINFNIINIFKKVNYSNINSEIPELIFRI